MNVMTPKISTEPALPAEFREAGGTDRLLAFNETLNGDQGQGFWNESDFDAMLAMLSAEAEKGGDPRLLCLIAARIAEMAVVTAGNYVDNCDFSAAGDLLFNPKWVDVYVNGHETPIRKKRHTRLSHQLAPLMGESEPVCWLTSNTMVNVRQNALLPHLRSFFKRSGIMATHYLDHIDRRCRKAADAMAFLMSWRIFSSRELIQRLQICSPLRKAFVEKNLCRFGWSDFFDLGKEIEALAFGALEQSDYLSSSVAHDPENRFYGASLCHY